MPDYRVLILSPKGKPSSFDGFGAISDRLAWEYVRVSFPAAAGLELWSGERQIDAPQQPFGVQTLT